MKSVRTHSMYFVKLQTLCVLLLAPLLSQAQEASFQGLGTLPGHQASQATSISGDGSTIGGASQSGGFFGTEAFRWTADDGMEGLGWLTEDGNTSNVFGTSFDGSVLIGVSVSADFVTQSFRWENGEMVALDFLPGCDNQTNANDVSADGLVVVGGGCSPNATPGFSEAIYWVDGNPMGLGFLEGGDNLGSVATAVSADGSVIVGWSLSANGMEAFRWENGEMTGLGDLPGGNFDSTALDVSPDGSIVVGRATSDVGFEAYRWMDGEMQALGLLPGMLFSSAQGVSADGSVVIVVGFIPEMGNDAYVWREGEGLRNLKEVLENDHGLDLTGWFLFSAEAISDDGTVIVGRGLNPDGGFEAWRVVLPPLEETGPENDHMSDAIEIPVANATYEGTNVNATLEDGEPEPSCTFSDWTTNYSVWWTFTAAADANRITIDTFGSDFDTILSLHRVDDLSEVACDDDTDGLQSQIEDASIVAGETYLIRVAGYDQSGANQGEIQLTTAFHWVSGEDGPNEIVQGLTHPSPNPARETASFTLTVDRGQQVTVEVFDMMGRRVQSLYEGSLTAGATETLRLNANTLSSGVYVIRALGEDFVDTQRITVVR